MRRLALLVLVFGFAAAGCGSGDDEAANGGDTTTAVSECTDVEAPEAREPAEGEKVVTELDSSKTYTLTFDTSCGSFTVTLDLETAPKTAASLVALAKDGYFDDTIFHRVAQGFVIQGGDRRAPARRGRCSRLPLRRTGRRGRRATAVGRRRTARLR